MVPRKIICSAHLLYVLLVLVVTSRQLATGGPVKTQLRQNVKLSGTSMKSMASFIGLEDGKVNRSRQIPPDQLYEIIQQREKEFRKNSTVKPYDIVRSLPLNTEGHNNCSVISFDLRSANQEEKLVKAELLLFTKLHLGSSRSSSDSDTRTVHIYRVIDAGEHRELVAEKTIALSHSLNGESKTRWESFDVLPAVSKWLTGEPNHGLHLDVLSNGESLECGSRRDVHFVRGYHQKHRPILLVYSHDLSEPIQNFPAQVDMPTGRSRRLASDELSRQADRVRDNTNSLNPRYCTRQSYRVDFTKFHKGLLSPTTLDIGICRGECLRPISPNAPQTNHARIQAILHQTPTLRSVIPAPCCSPQSLSRVTFFSYIGNSLVMITKHDIVAVECGCR